MATAKKYKNDNFVVVKPGGNQSESGNTNRGESWQTGATTVRPGASQAPVTGAQGSGGTQGNNPITGLPNASQGAQGGSQMPSQQQPVQLPTAGSSGNNSLLNMPGVSDATKQALGEMMANGYKPSQTVSDALAELNRIVANQPGEFQSGYIAQLNNIYNQILGRGPFAYNFAEDPMYLQYRQQYMQQGQQAMEDTMGQAAALTGGYGSSYATTAGQQAYNQQMQLLNDRIPELHQMALDAYNAEGDALNQQYGMITDAYNREYDQWADQYNRWLGERDFAQGLYDTERGYDYTQYADRLANMQNIAQMEQGAYEADRSFGLQQEGLDLDRLNADRNFGLANQQLALDRAGLELDRLAMQQDQDNANRKYYYSLALDMLDMGKVPPDSILLQAGLSADEIAALKADTGSSSGKGSSGKGSNQGSGSSSPKDYESYMALLGLGNKLGVKTGSGGSSGSGSSGSWLGNAADKAKAALGISANLQSIFDKTRK